jgi:DinB family protein
MKSPEFIVPEAMDYKKDYLLQSLDKIEEELLVAIKQLDLTQTCTSFELPVYGSLTRLEALSFVLYHTQRHIRQLKNIRDSIAA